MQSCTAWCGPTERRSEVLEDAVSQDQDVSEYGRQSLWRDTAGADAAKARELADRLELRAKAEDGMDARETNPTAQIAIIRDDGSSRVGPQVTVEVGDVDAVHAEAIRRGAEVVYPLTDERHGHGHRTPE